MTMWSSEIKELESQYKLLQGRFPDLEKELERVIKTDDVNMVLLYSRRCLEVIITDLCECELKRPRKTEPLKGIIDKLLKEQKVPTHIITSMDHLNTLSAYGAHPKDFDPEQVKPVLNNLDIIIKWYLKHKENQAFEPVKTGGATSNAKSSEIETREDSGKQKKRLILVLSGVLLVAVIIIVALFIFDVGGNKQAKALEKSIAVIPFINDSPDEENTYFINGLMDEVLNNLQKIKEISVASRTSVEQFRDKDRPAIPEIARKLGVNYIVEGSGQKYGNTVRLRVQLIDGNKDKHLWADSYEREIQKPEDIFNIQSQIAQTIASELKVIITPEEQQLIEKTPTTSLTAYDLYQKGNEQILIYLLENNKTETLDIAENLFREALKYDSSFARAYSGLALAYIYKNRENIESYFSERYLDSALILANRALLHDDQLAEAYYAKGIYCVETNNNDQALKEFNNALNYNSSYWEVYLAKGTWIYVLDYNHMDYVKAFENVNKAISLNHGKDQPGLLRWLGAGYVHYAGYDIGYEYWEKAFKLDGDTGAYLSGLAAREWYSGNREKAVELDLEVYNRDTNNVNSLSNLGSDYERLGRYGEALKYYQKYIKGMESLGQLMTGSLHRIGYVYWQNGNKKEAEYYLNEQKRVSEEAIRKGRRSYSGAYYDLAGVYAFLGQKEKAYENLRLWAKIPCPPKWWVDFIKEDHLFESIRNEPEFQKIVKDLDAKYQAEHERVGKWMKEQGLL